MAPTEDGLVLEVVTFGAGGRAGGGAEGRAGGIRCAIPAARVGARLAGSASVSAAVFEIAIETLLDLPPSPPETERLLLRVGERVLAVTAPVDLVRLEAKAIHPLPPLVAARCSLASLRALVRDENGLMLMIDGV